LLLLFHNGRRVEFSLFLCLGQKEEEERRKKKEERRNSLV